MRSVALGNVYSPQGNPHYGYAIVKVDRERNRVCGLVLWSDSRRLIPGYTWDESLSDFEKSTAKGDIVPWEEAEER